MTGFDLFNRSHTSYEANTLGLISSGLRDFACHFFWIQIVSQIYKELCYCNYTGGKF